MLLNFRDRTLKRTERAIELLKINVLAVIAINLSHP
jgi:hypothetical protein